MPISIRDRRMSSLYSDLERRNQSIDDQSVIKLLAAAGDRAGASFDKVAAALSKPGISRADQVALVQKGMSASEKKDLEAIVDQGSVPMSASAKNFLNAVLGRTEPQGNPLKIVLTADQRNGLVGKAGPGVVIEGINMTTAPDGRLHNDNTFEVARADSSGKFTGRMEDMREGDIVRIRARDLATDKVGDWVTVRVSGTGHADTRNAILNIERIGLTEEGDGKLSVYSVTRQISEPGAKVQFVNERTGKKFVATIDDEGQVPASFRLEGKKGDTFRVAATDGKNNVDFAQAAGTVALAASGGGGSGIDLPDPALHKDELRADGTPMYSTKRFKGPLFKNGPTPEDVMQGHLGDCYFPAALAALAKTHPDVIKNMIQDHGDGTYTVTFKGWQRGAYRDIDVEIDADLYVRAYGGPLYGATNSSDKSVESMELWFPLIEKAYAKFKGSYNDIGQGGSSADVFSEVLGRDGVSRTISASNKENVWKWIKSAVNENRPAAVGTYPESREALYTNTGVYSDHTYSVLGYKEVDGKRYVTLRNPWAESEPHGDGKDDGIFDMELDTFAKLYETFWTVE